MTQQSTDPKEPEEGFVKNGRVEDEDDELREVVRKIQPSTPVKPVDAL